MTRPGLRVTRIDARADDPIELEIDDRDEELEELRGALVEIDRAVRQGPEYCPLCFADFSRLDDHADDCTLGRLTPDYPPE